MRIVGFIGKARRYQDKPAGYLIAILVFGIAIGLREAVDPYIKVPYVTLFPAMVLCSLVGGRSAGILAAVIGGIAAWYLWLPPRGTFRLEWPVGHLTIALYVVTSVVLLLLMRGLNETMQALERERDLSADLFRELQHRTANNLQSISAMLRQNRRSIEADPSVALNVIDSAERRFEVMSRINRKLYSPEMHEVDASNLLRDLCEDLRRIGGNERVVCKVGQSTATLSRERAMLLSLLVSELMLNATKHAFEPGQAGTIEITLDARDDDLHFTFADDGKGFPSDAEVHSHTGLGTRIMQGLVAQLRGTMHTRSGRSGTTVEVIIPEH
jgi:two-component sensor histidine kinase